MPSEAFRTSPEFAMVLDQLVAATQDGDTVAVQRILASHSEWSEALEEERAFLLQIEETRPAAPAPAAVTPGVPATAHALPMPLAQAWIATLDAASTAARTESALFAFESYAVYLAAVAIGLYDASRTEDAHVTKALSRLGRDPEPKRWIDTLDEIGRWHGTRSQAADVPNKDVENGTPPADGMPLARNVPILRLLEEVLSRPIQETALTDLSQWLGQLHGRAEVDGETSLRGLLTRILGESATYHRRAQHAARGTDAERTAELLEAGVGGLFASDSILRSLPCGYVRSVERIGKDLYQHDVIDLMGLSPLTRRGGLLHPGEQLEPGRVYVFPASDLGQRSPLSMHPFFVYQHGSALRLSFDAETDHLAYSACRPGEGRVTQPVNQSGHGRIESLVLPRLERGSPLPTAVLPGGKSQIGDFRILRQIGEGGMALVYLAEQQSIGREAALKVLHRTRLTTSFIERFRREGKAIGRLEHPNIVKVHAIGEEDGIPYLAMEYVHGAALDQRLRESEDDEKKRTDTHDPTRKLPRAVGDRSPMETICRITREIAMALDHAHGHGIIHRDVKPGNILIDEEGHAHLTDFGLAQERGKASLTMTGDMVGTPHFLSPEQVAAKRIEIDHRTDIYSLGVTLYQMLTGRMPFEGETLEQILRQIALKEPLAPRKIKPKISRDLETICLHAMEKDPDARYASAQEMADDLHAVAELRPIQASRAGPMSRVVKLARRRPAVAVLSVALTVAMIAWGGTSLARRSRDAAVVRESMDFGTKLLDADRPDKALPYFERVLEVDGTHEAAKANLNRIRFTLERERAYELAFDWEDPTDPAGLERCLESLARLRQYGQDASDVELLEAQVRVRRGNLDNARMPEAIRFLDRLDASSPGIKLLRAIALGGTDRPQEAARLRKEVEESALQTERDRLVLAGALMAEARWADALRHYEVVLQRGDLHTRRAAASQAARCCYWLGDYRRALAHLRFLESEHRTQPPHLLRRRALYSWRLGDAAGAIADLDQALAQDANYVLALNARGVILHRQRRLEEALADFGRALKLDPRLAYAYANRGQVRFQLGDFAGAIADLDKALSLGPDLRAARLARARIYVKHGNNLAARTRGREEHAHHNSALGDLRALVSSFGPSPTRATLGNAEDRRILASALALRSEVYLNLRKLAFAAQDAAAAVGVEPTVAYAHYASALVNAKRGEYVDAREALGRAIEHDPGFPGAFAKRADILYQEAMGDGPPDFDLLEDARDDLDRALELEPGTPEPLINRAWIHLLLARRELERGDMEAATANVERASTDGTAALAVVQSAQVHLVFFEVHQLSDRTDEALEAVETALAADPKLWLTHYKIADFYERLNRANEEPDGSAGARIVAFGRETMRQAQDEETKQPPPPNLAAHLEGRIDRARKRAARAFFRGEAVTSPLERSILAYAYSRRNPDKARKELRRATAEVLHLESEQGTIARVEHKAALLELATLARLLDQNDTALTLLNRLLTLDASHDAAIDLRRELRSRRQ